MDDLVDGLVDEVSGWHRSFIPIEHAILLHPVHAEEAQECSEGDDGLQRDIEACEHEEIDDVDVLIAYLELDALMEGIMFTLTLIQLALYVKSTLTNHSFDATDELIQIVDRVKKENNRSYHRDTEGHNEDGVHQSTGLVDVLVDVDRDDYWDQDRVDHLGQDCFNC